METLGFKYFLIKKLKVVEFYNKTDRKGDNLKLKYLKWKNFTFKFKIKDLNNLPTFSLNCYKLNNLKLKVFFI